MKGINHSKSTIACSNKKVLSHAHVCSLEQSAGNVHDPGVITWRGHLP